MRNFPPHFLSAMKFVCKSDFHSKSCKTENGNHSFFFPAPSFPISVFWVLKTFPHDPGVHFRLWACENFVFLPAFFFFPQGLNFIFVQSSHWSSHTYFSISWLVYTDSCPFWQISPYSSFFPQYLSYAKGFLAFSFLSLRLSFSLRFPFLTPFSFS